MNRAFIPDDHHEIHPIHSLRAKCKMQFVDENLCLHGAALIRITNINSISFIRTWINWAAFFCHFYWKKPEVMSPLTSTMYNRPVWSQIKQPWITVMLFFNLDYTQILTTVLHIAVKTNLKFYQLKFNHYNNKISLHFKKQLSKKSLWNTKKKETLHKNFRKNVYYIGLKD